MRQRAAALRRGKSFALGLAAAQSVSWMRMLVALLLVRHTPVPFYCHCVCLQLHLRPASELMKANLRINFKRICFDAVISRQNGSPPAPPPLRSPAQLALSMPAKKSVCHLGGSARLSHWATLSCWAWPVLISVNSPAGRHLSVLIIAVNRNWILQCASGIQCTTTHTPPHLHKHTSTHTLEHALHYNCGAARPCDLLRPHLSFYAAGLLQLLIWKYTAQLGAGTMKLFIF